MKKTTKSIEKTEMIFARLSKRQFSQLVNKEYSIGVPMGVSMRHKRGSRNLTFLCPTKALFEIMTSALDEDNILWQKY